MVREAAGQGTPIEVRGGGTFAGLGRPNQAEKTLTTVGLQGITLYEPTELVLSAHAGTTLMEIDAALQGAGQRLAFEPVDFRTLLATPAIRPSAAWSRPNRRLHAASIPGAVRDSLIGVRMVTGRGEAVNSGGRVMKNVTGYDLVKLACGAYGTLGVLSEVTFKTLPDAEDERTLLYNGLDDAHAVAAMTAALGSPYEVSGAAHLPSFTMGPGRTLIRLQGFRHAVAHRVEALTAALVEHGTPELLPAASRRAGGAPSATSSRSASPGRGRSGACRSSRPMGRRWSTPCATSAAPGSTTGAAGWCGSRPNPRAMPAPPRFAPR